MGCGPSAPVVKETAVAKEPAASKDFGETPGLVPSWSLPQEARAPKMPDAAERWTSLEAPRTIDTLTNGLLICSVQIAAKNDPTHFPWGGWHPPTNGDDSDRPTFTGADWDTMNGPDALIRFRLGSDRAISLWGPENHWAMYVSIPRVTLHRGEAVQIDVWDRDLTENEHISTIDTTFGGTFPWRFEAKWLRFDCRGAPDAEAQAWAAPIGAKIDKIFSALDSGKPEERLDFSAPGLEALKSPLRLFGQPNLRYYAGYLGWESPELQARIHRLAAAENSWNGKVRVAVLAAAARAAPPGKIVELGEGSSLSITATDGPSGASYSLRAPRGLPDLQIVGCDGTTVPAKISAVRDGTYTLTTPTSDNCLLRTIDLHREPHDLSLRPAPK